MHSDYSNREKEVLNALNTYSNYFLVGQNSDKRGDLNVFYRNWIGVKIVGKKYPDQTMKMNLNSMSSYLIDSNDYLIKDDLDKLIRLEHIRKNDKNYVLSDVHKKLIGRCLFVKVHKYKNKQNYILMVNVDYENLLDKNSDKYKTLQAIKVNAFETYKKIESLLNECKSIKSRIKDEYSTVRYLKSSISSIIQRANDLKDKQNEIKFLQNQLLDLIDDYNILTNQHFK